MKLEEAFGDQLDSLRNTACVFRLGEDSVELLDEADMLVISPGVPDRRTGSEGCQGRWACR